MLNLYVDCIQQIMFINQSPSFLINIKTNQTQKKPIISYKKEQKALKFSKPVQMAKDSTEKPRKKTNKQK